MHVADDAEVGDAEDGGVGVLVDGHDDAGVLHSHEVLRGAGDAAGDVHVGLDDLAGLAHLVGVGHPTGVDDGPGGACRPAQEPGELLDHVVLAGLAQPPAARDDHGRLVQLGTLGLLGLTADHSGVAGGAEIDYRQLGELCRRPADGLGHERLGADQEDLRAGAAEAGVHVGGAAEDRLDAHESAVAGHQLGDVGDDRHVEARRQATGHVPAVVGGGEQQRRRGVVGGCDGRCQQGRQQRAGQHLVGVGDVVQPHRAVLAHVGGHSGGVAARAESLDAVADAPRCGQQFQRYGCRTAAGGLGMHPDGSDAHHDLPRGS